MPLWLHLRQLLSKAIFIYKVSGQLFYCCCLQVSYMILQRVSPVTHSIGNCLKRVIVIVASVIFFKNPVSQQNVIGRSLKP